MPPDMTKLIDAAAVQKVTDDLEARAEGQTLVEDTKDLLGLLYQDMIDQVLYIATIRS